MVIEEEEMTPEAIDRGNVMLEDEVAIEKLAKKFHKIYQKEAKRQGDKRHPDRYEDLSENIKEFDRVLARFVLGRMALLRQKLWKDRRCFAGDKQKTSLALDYAEEHINQTFEEAKCQ